MLSVEKCRQLIPGAENISDQEIIEIRESLYELGQLAFEDWLKNKEGSKNHEWLLRKMK